MQLFQLDVIIKWASLTSPKIVNKSIVKGIIKKIIIIIKSPQSYRIIFIDQITSLIIWTCRISIFIFTFQSNVSELIKDYFSDPILTDTFQDRIDVNSNSYERTTPNNFNVLREITASVHFQSLRNPIPSLMSQCL